MRKGNNPNKSMTPAAQFPKEIATVTVHLPDKSEYHAGRFEIVRACLESMRRFSGVPVLVWDNGSSLQIRRWLMDVYRPDYLVLSPNVGKLSARSHIVGMLPDDCIVSFTDDDMLFYPDWWKVSKKLLNGFPNVGAVSGYPVRSSFRWATTSTVAWAESAKTASIERGRLIPEEYEREYASSVGMPWEVHAKNTAADEDIRITHNGFIAYATSQHCQFMTRAGVIREFCKPSIYAMGPERDFDESIDKAGYLRLTTIERLSRHMGNVLDPEIEAEIARLGL